MSQQEVFQHGATDQQLVVFLQNTDGTPKTGVAFDDAGLAATFWRRGASAVVDIPLVTQTLSGVHADGGFVEIDDTLMPGSYRLDTPDAIAVAGVSEATLQITGTSLVHKPVSIKLTPYDPNVDGLTQARSEPTAPPPANASIVEAVLYMLAKDANHQTETLAGAKTLRNRANSADIAAATLTDDGTTFTKSSDT